MSPTFGKRSKDRPQSAGGEYEMYLKTFGEGQNRIRILEDDPNNWVDYKEHFDNAMKMSFPCAKYEGAEECKGCDYPVEHPEYADLDTHFPGVNYSQQRDTRKKLDKGWAVRDVSRKWIFPCIDDKNYISIFKIGAELKDEFIAHYAALGSVTGTEFVVTRTGKGFDTKTRATPVPGAVREPKYAIPGEKEIQETLGSKYAYALEKYGFDLDEAAALDGPAVDEPVVDPANIAPQAPETGAPAETKTEQFIPREAAAGEVKDWLTAHQVDYPARAARQVLVGLAERKMTELADLPPF